LRKKLTNPEVDSWAIAPIVGEGVKHDQDKLRFDLVPSDVEVEIAKIFTIGAKKYGDRNWEKGISNDRLYAAARRHLVSHRTGEKTDPEFGTPHLAHAIVNLMMMLHFELEEK